MPREVFSRNPATVNDLRGIRKAMASARKLLFCVADADDCLHNDAT
jgi:hypothetical protein